MTRNQEGPAVKKALAAAGYRVKSVTHGTGTARYWLHIKLADPTWTWEIDRAIIAIAQRVTGRRGDYDGCIQVN